MRKRVKIVKKVQIKYKWYMFILVTRYSAQRVRANDAIVVFGGGNTTWKNCGKNARKRRLSITDKPMTR